MQYYIYALLGIIQGLTEFLPVSSSGHLVLAEHWLKTNPPGVMVEVALHVATLISVVLVYRRDLLAILAQRNWGYLWLVVLATIVTAVLVLPFKDILESLADGPLAVRLSGAMLLVTGAWLVLADLRLLRQPRQTARLGWKSTVLTGIAQAVAALPGISRSGATIGTLVQLGESREAAARFSFIISIPVILGAAVLKAGDVPQELASGAIDPLALGLGMLLALASGIVAIHLVLWMLRRARLRYFAGYCFALGIVALAVG